MLRIFESVCSCRYVSPHSSLLHWFRIEPLIHANRKLMPFVQPVIVFHRKRESEFSGNCSTNERLIVGSWCHWSSTGRSRSITVRIAISLKVSFWESAWSRLSLRTKMCRVTKIQVLMNFIVHFHCAIDEVWTKHRLFWLIGLEIHFLVAFGTRVRVIDSIRGLIVLGYHTIPYWGSDDKIKNTFPSS